MKAVIMSVKTHAPHLAPQPEIPVPTAPPAASEKRTIKFVVPISLAPLWERLHLRALQNEGTNDTKWIDGYGRMLPCGNCRMHWNQMLQRTPPTWDRYFQWTVDRHNEVNALLGKPPFTNEEALAKWGTSEISKPD